MEPTHWVGSILLSLSGVCTGDSQPDYSLGTNKAVVCAGVANIYVVIIGPRHHVV